MFQLSDRDIAAVGGIWTAKLYMLVGRKYTPPAPAVRVSCGLFVRGLVHVARMVHSTSAAAQRCVSVAGEGSKRRRGRGLATDEWECYRTKQVCRYFDEWNQFRWPELVRYLMYLVLYSVLAISTYTVQDLLT